jgi:very-short-patch-repair endonuclease
VPVHRRTSPHARRLRSQATDVEQRFWLAVRDRRLGGYKFRRQASIGPFVVDFLCVERRLVVELDGGQHGGEDDRRRTEFLERADYRVLRFWNNDVLENEEGVLLTVLAALEGAGPPSPNPLPPAGEG